MKITCQRIYLLVLCLCALIADDAIAKSPKREFRGAWMTTVYQEQYAKQTTEQNKQYICRLLDKMHDLGINAVLFQARPSADAFYDSKIEPWSRFLSPAQTAPTPYWDPLEFIVTEAHRRGMELHAWINPYRVTTSKTQTLPKNHIYHKHPERFIRYQGDGLIYFDPGVPENREYIVEVMHDIINRYNIDGLHFDDYFYPYPVAGKEFDDSKSFAKYGKGMTRADWRRRNVDLLIEDIHNMIVQSKKCWVRFGISPFGIWRNASSDSRGSATNGLQNYDDLYADVLLWAEKGWIDYLVPQLYWELDHKSASSATLIDWWAVNVPENCHLYIGQSVDRTMKAADVAPSRDKNQLGHKIRLSRTTPGVQGNCWFPVYQITDNFMGIGDDLRKKYHSTPALVPAYATLSANAPKGVYDLRSTNQCLSWEAPKILGVADDAVKFVVYRFASGEEINIDDPSKIVAITPERSISIPGEGVYVVTSLSRVNVESAPSESIVVH